MINLVSILRNILNDGPGNTGNKVAQGAKKGKVGGAIGGAIAGAGAMRREGGRQTPSQRHQYAQYKNADGSGGGFSDQRPMPRMMMGGFPRNARYEDEGFVGYPESLNQYSPMNADIRNFQGINPDFGIRMQGGLRGIQNGGGFDPMQSAARMQYGAQNQFQPGQNPLQNEDYRNILRVR